jgi:senataxin
METFRNNFCTLVTYLRRCLVELKDRFSDMLLKNENISDIGKMLDNLKKLENLVSHEIDEKSVLRSFGFVSTGQSTSGLHDCSAAEDLNCVRLECSKYLKDLKGSIELPPQFADRTAVENYCIEKCPVVVSTVCSAFRLHKMNPGKFDLLIVDDASDIRECDLTIPLRLSIQHVWMLGDDSIQTLSNKVHFLSSILPIFLY